MSEQPKRKSGDNITLSGESLNQVFRTIWEKGNERQLIVRSKDGSELLSLPLTAVVVLAAVALFFAMPFAIGAVVLAYIMGVRFELVRFTREEDSSIVYTDTKPTENQ